MQETLDIYSNSKIRHVSFRKLVPEIPSTKYATHGIYYYPARFIPQVVRWAIHKYSKIGDWIIDPFGGSGTVAVEALITKRKAVCLDLNPIIDLILEAKTSSGYPEDKIVELANDILLSEEEYEPLWSRIRYWHPTNFYDVLKKMWGGYIKHRDPLTLIALLITTKKFSYADDQVPKLFKSKRKTKWVENLAKSSNYVKIIHQYFTNCLTEINKACIEFSKFYDGDGEYYAKGGVDLLDYQPDGTYKLMITSPPYGTAHEYIRSIKLELAWLGFSDEQIKELTKKEIPYNRKVPDIEIKSPTYYNYLNIITNHTRQSYIRYFKSILSIFEKIMQRLETGGYACIFVGNATFSGIEPPYAKIFVEHLESKGYKFEELLIDRIKSRKLFKNRKNLSPNGIGMEYLLIMKKN